MIDIAVYNRNRKQENLALFEIGGVFVTEEAKLTKQPDEVPALGLLLAGEREPKRWNAPAEQVDFFDLKGALESLFDYLGLGGRVSYAADRPQGFHPGRSASVYLQTEGGKRWIGSLGQVHPELQRELDLDDTYVAELLLKPIYEYAGEPAVYRELPRFPAMQRDIAVVVAADVEAGALIAEIRQTAGKLLEDVQVFDVFTGSKLGEGKKSVALSLVYRHKERTLTDEEVTAVHDRVVAGLAQTFAAELRK